MPEINCPKCGKPRTVSEVVYKRLLKNPKWCRSCSQIANQTPEQRDKIRAALTGRPKSEEMRHKLSEYMKAHPEAWQGRVATGAGGGWNKGLSLSPRSEETKEKIRQSMMGKNKGKVLGPRNKETGNE